MRADLCIRGAGIVGRTLALLLAGSGLRVALVQAAPTGTRDVRAYSLNASARSLLQSLRVWPDEAAVPSAVTPVQRMRVMGDRGGQLQFDQHEMGETPLNWMVDVPVLEEQLAQAVQFQPLIEVRSEPVDAPLTVICEGRASRTRAEFGVEFEVQAYPPHAVAARLHVAVPHGAQAWQWFGFGEADSGTRASEVLALLPMGGAAGQEVALVWSVHPHRAQQLMALSPEDFGQALTQACGQVLGPMQLCSERVVWPLQLARASRWIGRVPGQAQRSFALAGDAAHAMHPLAGQGLNVGLGDAAELARVLQGREFWRSLDDLRLLRRYERARAADVQAMSLVTDGLQHLFSPQQGMWPVLRNWGLNAFDRSGPIKQAFMRHAMGRPTPPTPGASS